MYLSENGWSVDMRERFDHVLMIALMRDGDQADVEPAELEKELNEAGYWLESTKIKMVK